MFTPIETTLGAVLLHQATSLLLYNNGSILGASGLLRNLLSAPSKSTLAFFAGMAASSIPLMLWAPEVMTVHSPGPVTPLQALITVGCGLLVGWGTKNANGCTSGHMLCGLPRLSGRSTIAVATFFPAAILTHHLTHASLVTSACPGDKPCYLPAYPSRSTALALTLLTTLSIVFARTTPHLLARLTQATANTPTSPTTTEKQNPAPPNDANAPARLLTLFNAGLLFALGLQTSGMADPAKVSSFLSLPVWAHWDPSMLLVVVFGILPSLVELQMLRGLEGKPVFAEGYGIPKKGVKDVDWRFVAGAAAFGVGWGVCGTCPGPAVLKALVRPVWGALWMGGFALGGLLA